MLCLRNWHLQFCPPEQQGCSKGKQITLTWSVKALRIPGSNPTRLLEIVYTHSFFSFIVLCLQRFWDGPMSIDGTELSKCKRESSPREVNSGPDNQFLSFYGIQGFITRSTRHRYRTQSKFKRIQSTVAQPYSLKVNFNRLTYGGRRRTGRQYQTDDLVASKKSIKDLSSVR
jgi:hypothetical protein